MELWQTLSTGISRGGRRPGRDKEWEGKGEHGSGLCRAGCPREIRRWGRRASALERWRRKRGDLQAGRSNTGEAEAPGAQGRRVPSSCWSAPCAPANRPPCPSTRVEATQRAGADGHHQGERASRCSSEERPRPTHPAGPQSHSRTPEATLSNGLRAPTTLPPCVPPASPALRLAPPLPFLCFPSGGLARAGRQISRARARAGSAALAVFA